VLFDNQPHVGLQLQLDMWTDRETKISHARITATMVLEPVKNPSSSKLHAAVRAERDHRVQRVPLDI
jgi:hypothetical protein